MKMSTAKVLEGTDHVRGLARAAWARLQRSDLGDEENAAAQEEYARCRDELLELGIEIELTSDEKIKCSVAKRSRHGPRACALYRGQPVGPRSRP